MPKTTLSRDTVIDIRHYFEFLKQTYKITNKQLVNATNLDKNTVSRYTSEKPLTSLPTEETITILIDGFTNILGQRDIPCPAELSSNFLFSPHLHSFLESLENPNESIESTADSQCTDTANDSSHVVTDPPSEDETPIVLNRNPMRNKTLISYLITILFGFGGSVVTVLGIFFSQVQSFKLLVLGAFCLSVALTLALPYLKQPLEISPKNRYLHSHVKFAKFLAYFSQIAILILYVLLPPINYRLLLLLFS